MRRVALPPLGTVAAWRAAARALIAEGVAPAEVRWSVGEGAPDLFDAGEAVRPSAESAASPLRVPRAAIETIETALLHRDPERFARAHDCVARLARGALRWSDPGDPAAQRLRAMAKATRRDMHKMRAFLRFRELAAPGAPRRRFGAWFEPDHFILEATAPFFARRFGDMDWAIATPTHTARFVDGRLEISAEQGARPAAEDETGDLWLTYYANIFNPARVKLDAMRAEMPKKYWAGLPETRLIPDLVRDAPARVAAMRAAEARAPSPRLLRRAAAARLRVQSPETACGTLEEARGAALGCARCPLHGPATQTVWGEGPPRARLMIVGEQPGDREDLTGRPFVGPAGRVLDAALAEAGVDRDTAWLTNAVKHFKYRRRGKARLHQAPDRGEVERCRWWLDLERRLVRPRVVLALGATALFALTGDGSRLGARRGRLSLGGGGALIAASWHPAYILRRPDIARAEEARAQLAADISAAARAAERSASGEAGDEDDEDRKPAPGERADRDFGRQP